MGTYFWLFVTQREANFVYQKGTEPVETRGI